MECTAGTLYTVAAAVCTGADVGLGLVVAPTQAHPILKASIVFFFLPVSFVKRSINRPTDVLLSQGKRWCPFALIESLKLDHDTIIHLSHSFERPQSNVINHVSVPQYGDA